VTDAKNILTGGDTSVTEFFVTRRHASPLVRALFARGEQVPQKTWALPRSYNAFAGKAASFGLLKPE
jgi:hypothetical protein